MIVIARGVIVVVAEVMLVLAEAGAVAVAEQTRRPARHAPTDQTDEQCGAERCDEYTTGHTEPSEHDLAGQRRRHRERHPEQEDAPGVGRGHGGADHEGVADGALASCDVGRHHGLAVSGQECVGCAEHDRQAECEQPDSDGQFAPRNQVVEHAAQRGRVPTDSIDRVGARRRRVVDGGRYRDGGGVRAYLERCCANVHGRRQQVDRVDT